ncbi:META domain-containing protein [Microbacterium rhizophilus]|uniref:META domain-containing protein n=1 Tax=Microbacterium rhizophilus TaxID=3138934 RepID=UPI0031EA9EEC
MSMRRLAATGLAAAALLILTACASGAGGASPAGSWGEEPGPNVTISDDGTVVGSDGCNRLTGKGTIDGDRIEFGDLAQTRMACAEGTDVVEPWATSAAVDGNALILFDEAGQEIRRLPRIEREG